MCGRFVITQPSDAMAQLFDAQPDNDLPDVPNYNVCPTNQIHVVSKSEGGARRLTQMRWGFLPAWYKTTNAGPLLINARSETIAHKPAFREAVRARRALVAVTGFYEWTKTPEGQRNPWYITRADGAAIVMAAVWQDWTSPEGDVLRSCALVTTGANAPMSKIHHRMPVILQQRDWPLWLGEAGHGAAVLMRAAPDDALRMHRVKRDVNSNRASGAALIHELIDDDDVAAQAMVGR
ncbi:SOS response-associated peptidase [uncultured Roseobacter sp.]|uniref:SOS response-associated peptidase n=1 Tax=uncultured Roseobacter sp. TaxID=114847 RepID=UPI00263065C4|nr:SOS response-associated peptidase [uncultured Roseobacter sp.]